MGDTEKTVAYGTKIASPNEKIVVSRPIFLQILEKILNLLVILVLIKDASRVDSSLPSRLLIAIVRKLTVRIQGELMTIATIKWWRVNLFFARSPLRPDRTRSRKPYQKDMGSRKAMEGHTFSHMLGSHKVNKGRSYLYRASHCILS